MLPRKWRSCGRLRLDRRAEIGGPHHLIGRRLDLLALEQIGAVPVAGEVQHPAALRLQRPGDREQHGVAEAAAGQQHRLVRRDLGRRAGRAHHHHRLARLQERAQPARHAHLQRDERQQAGLAIDPGAGEGDALHQQRRDVIVGVHADTAALEVLQPVELARMEVPRRGRGPHDHLDDRRGQPDHPLDPRQQLVVEPRHQRLPGAVARRLLRRVQCRQLRGEERDHLGIAVLGRGHGLDDVAVVARVVVAVVADESAVAGVRGEEAVRIGLEGEPSGAGRHGSEALEEARLAVEREAARMLLLVGDVGGGAGGDEHRARRQLDAGIDAVYAGGERHPLDVAVEVGKGFDRVQPFGEGDAFLERLLHFLVVQAVGRGVLQPLAVGQRDAAPGAHQRDEVGRFAGARRRGRARRARRGRGSGTPRGCRAPRRRGPRARAPRRWRRPAPRAGRGASRPAAGSRRAARWRCRCR